MVAHIPRPYARCQVRHANGGRSGAVPQRAPTPSPCIATFLQQLRPWPWFDARLLPPSPLPQKLTAISTPLLDRVSRLVSFPDQVLLRARRAIACDAFRARARGRDGADRFRFARRRRTSPQCASGGLAVARHGRLDGARRAARGAGGARCACRSSRDVSRHRARRASAARSTSHATLGSARPACTLAGPLP